jgi:hypothetical protein
MEQDLNMQRAAAAPSSMMAAHERAAATLANIANIGTVRVSGPVALRQFRMSKRESQATFWARFGVTQSSGSRFETGLGVPPAVALLVRLYANGRLNDGDLLG